MAGQEVSGGAVKLTKEVQEALDRTDKAYSAIEKALTVRAINRAERTFQMASEILFHVLKANTPTEQIDIEDQL